MTVNSRYLTLSGYGNARNISKKTLFEETNHHLRIKHLIEKLNSPKSYQDRLKDTNDFLAHPTLFFRYIMINI
jgi:hypothetical protein